MISIKCEGRMDELIKSWEDQLLNGRTLEDLETVIIPGTAPVFINYSIHTIYTLVKEMRAFKAGMNSKK